MNIGRLQFPGKVPFWRRRWELNTAEPINRPLTLSKRYGVSACAGWLCTHVYVNTQSFIGWWTDREHFKHLTSEKNHALPSDLYFLQGGKDKYKLFSCPLTKFFKVKQLFKSQFTHHTHSIVQKCLATLEKTYKKNKKYKIKKIDIINSKSIYSFFQLIIKHSFYSCVTPRKQGKS